ncbi:MAG: UDP-glucose/GDP-mannose dehydrogenase family protein [Saprospiraceae bacterium]|nr:UDP-glucose/GDP-mannose dehydrogenase family protein [Saprospiraceae bacterium]
MNIAIVGTGYVGLVSGTCFAHAGNSVICVDINEEKVHKLSNGELTIYEPGLEYLYADNLAKKRLSFTTDLEKAVQQSDIICMCLPTPSDEDGSADLTHVLKVAEQLGPMIDSYKIIVNKSTVPVGTVEKVKDEIAKNASADFDVVSNPEFLREGFAVNDFMKPDRVIVGTDSRRAQRIMAKLFAPFLPEGNPVIFMDERSAEMTKYAANSYLATRITFMNEIATLCEKLGANVDDVRKGMGSDTRIGHRFLFSGIGYGGSCFPKDVRALVNTSSETGYDFAILQAVLQRNKYQQTRFVEKVKKHFNNQLDNVKVAVWGLAFKPNTDDIREAPALAIIDELLRLGAKITAYDPAAMANVEKMYPGNIHFCNNEYDVLDDADVLCIFTEWKDFLSPNFDIIKKKMKSPVIIDGRNIYTKEEMKEHGFTYISMGRETINETTYA